MTDAEKEVSNAKRRIFDVLARRHGDESKYSRRKERLKWSKRNQRYRRHQKKEAEKRKAAIFDEEHKTVKETSQRTVTKWTRLNKKKKPSGYESKISRDANLREAIMMHSGAKDETTKHKRKRSTRDNNDEMRTRKQQKTPPAAAEPVAPSGPLANAPHLRSICKETPAARTRACSVQQKAVKASYMKAHRSKIKEILHDINLLHRKLGKPKHRAYYKHRGNSHIRDDHDNLMKFYSHFFDPFADVGFRQSLSGPLTYSNGTAPGSKLYWQIWQNKLLNMKFIREFRCYTEHESLNPKYCYLCERAQKDFPAGSLFTDWGLDKHVAVNSQYYDSGADIKCFLADTHDFYVQLKITAKQADNFTARVKARRILELTGEEIGRLSFSKATSNDLLMTKRFYFGCGCHGVNIKQQRACP